MSTKPLEVVQVKDSKRAVHLVAEHICGSRIRFEKLFERQNMLITPHPRYSTINEFKQKLEPDCWNCLSDSYDYGHRIPVFTHYNGGMLSAPKRLEECREALAGIVPTVEMETDDGIKFSFALSQGCRTGWGIMEERKFMDTSATRYGGRPRESSYFIINPSTKDANDAHPFVFPDPKIIPVTMRGKFSFSFGTSGGSSSDEFWKAAQMEPLPVRGVALTNREESDGVITRSADYLEFTFKAKEQPTRSVIDMRYFSLNLDLGEFSSGVESFFWIDMIAKDGFTTRFMIDNGFPGLLFPNHFKTPF